MAGRVTVINVRKNIFPFKEFHNSGKPVVELTSAQSALINDFNQKVKSARADDFEEVPCLCGNTSFDLIASIDRYAISQQTLLCTTCGLIQSNPRMAERKYQEFYASDLYRRCYSGEEYLERLALNYQKASRLHIFNVISKIKNITSDLAVLEFGAGGGWNLLPFIKNGAQVIGMDYSPSLVELGRRHGIKMIQGGIDEIEGSFDVIILDNVLEHFLDPVGSLKIIKEHLKNDGIIYIALPNIMNFGLGQLQNSHTYYFDPKTFKYYSCLAGLKITLFCALDKIQMFGIFQLAAESNNNSLNNHYKEVLGYLGKTRIRFFIKHLLMALRLDGLARFIICNLAKLKKI